jgi:peptidoglycan/xylan/chitin deacetylase (PgdA/CDA1 family)
MDALRSPAKAGLNLRSTLRPYAPTRRLRLELRDVRGLRAARQRLGELQKADTPAGLAIVYHRIGSAGDRNFELDPALSTSLFKRQLWLLEHWFRVVTAADLPDAVERRHMADRFPVAITFDDDLPSHTAVAAPLLRLRRIPATFFLCNPACAEGTAWWLDLQHVIDKHRIEAHDLKPVDPELVDAALERRPLAIRRVAVAIEGLPPALRDELRGILRERADGREAAALSAKEASELVSNGFTVGCHTPGHYDLRALDDAMLRRELDQGRADLLPLIGRAPDLLAYPHGKADARVARAARRAGFDVGFTGRAEPVTPKDNPLLLGRVQPSYESLGRFASDLVHALGQAQK